MELKTHTTAYIPNRDWPGKQGVAIITRVITDESDATWFADKIASLTNYGYTIKNCGINGSASDVLLMWAILTVKVWDKDS